MPVKLLQPAYGTKPPETCLVLRDTVDPVGNKPGIAIEREKGIWIGEAIFLGVQEDCGY
jgi:hypothetical protein